MVVMFELKRLWRHGVSRKASPVMSRNTYPVRVSRVVARDIRKSAEIPHPEVHEVTCTFLQQTDPGEDFDRYIRIENRLMAPDKCAVFFLDVYSLK